MKKPTYPKFINLKELETEGEEFVYTRETGELNTVLADLINKHDYHVDLRLAPAGNAFGITGKISTSLDLICARCGRETVFPVQDVFHEMIVVMKEKPRAGHSGHTGGDHEGIFCNYTTTYEFSLGDFVHEHIAAAEPYAPQCSRADCERYFQALAEGSKVEAEPAAHNPFAVLKNLTPKGQRD